jgi:low affinity Fe/Cu permease
VTPESRQARSPGFLGGGAIGAGVPHTVSHGGDVDQAKRISHVDTVWWGRSTSIRANTDSSSGIRVASRINVPTQTLGRRLAHGLETFSEAATRWTGSTTGFSVAAATIVVWAVLGRKFGFSDTWQLVINTGTTIVTFLMVFLIQRAQNKEALALHLKLNEIVAALKGASNRLIDAEALPEEDLNRLERHYRELAMLAKKSDDLTESHSVEEARERDSAKRRRQRRRPANE